MEANNLIDMTGWVMSEHGVPESRLTVIKKVESYISPSGKRKAQWLCECSCEEHNKVVVTAGNLRYGIVLSCGCYNREKNKRIFKKYNNYSDKLNDEYGEYYIGYTSNTNKEFYIDADDYDKIKDYCWYESKNEGFSRLETNINGKIVRMHIFLGYKYYDHEDRNELNNRKYNLRSCTAQENSINKGKRKDNTSGITGVSLNKSRNTWVAQITVTKKTITIGSFKNKDDAIKARLKAEAEYYGEFAPQKYLFKEYGIPT